MFNQESKMFLITVIMFAYCSSYAFSKECYNCQNFEFESEFYDPDCNNDQYTGHEFRCDEGEYCFTDVYEDGRFHRGCKHTTNGFGCVHHNYPKTTQCFCEGELCNKGTCSECGGGPTVPRTTGTTPTNEGTTPSGPTTPSSSTITSSTVIHETTTLPSSSTTMTLQTTTTSIVTDLTTPPTPQTPTNTPEVTTSSSEVSSDSPIITTPTPEVSTPIPEVSTPTPEVSTQTPEVSTTIPTISSSSSTPTLTVVETTTPIKITKITCYDCQNTHPDWEAFDETCPVPGYDGGTYACDNCGSCFTEIH
ncbi:unnamed protein product, partial [Meganyctiphanes norvegica]